MAACEYTVKPLFAEPYFITSIADAISPEQIKFIKGLKMLENQVNMISEELYIFDQPELRSIADAVQASLDTYASEIMGISQELYVTQSWALANPPGVGMHGHAHSNSIVSGSLYYSDLPEPVSNMIFDRHRMYQQLALSPEEGKANIYNTTKNIVQPKKGSLVLFSSSLLHFVEPNQSSETRHSIAFNTFLRGKIGSFRDVSELVLP
tara:strand:+ start:7119 stop:7742 length:624 start_codon:yes stop_codon:yes gene_type:complete